MIKALTEQELMVVQKTYDIIPTITDIPPDFPQKDKFRRFFNDWFHYGLSDLQVTVKMGANREDVIRHLSHVMHAYDLTIEDKAMSLSYLMSQWCDDISWRLYDITDRIEGRMMVNLHNLIEF
jgi:hypothetical protein